MKAGTGVRARGARAALMATVFVCAACGLVYELALVALGSYLLGNTAEQASIVLGVMVFAMGIGALAAKPLQRRAAVSFALIELALAFFGGLSVIVLYAAFAWLQIYTIAMVGMALLLGALIGAEIPLLMVMLQRIRRQAAGSAVADLFAADYIGGLLGGLAFPFLLLPLFGQLRGALIVGAVNAVAGLALVFIVFRKDLGKRGRITLSVLSALVALTLVGGYVYSHRFEAAAQQALYADPIIYSEQTQYQRIVITDGVTPFDEKDTRLYLNGDLQFASVDEYRYHEALVHPAMAGERSRVLILGGGDGLALREVLDYPDVESVTLVELDPAMTGLAATHPILSELNDHAFDDPRVTVVNDDAFGWLREERGAFDAIVVDMPDPDETATAKLYSVEFYALAARHLTEDGAMVVQSGSPYFAPKSFWCINATISEAGLVGTPYHVEVPSFGDWGFHLVGAKAPPLALDPPSPLRSLDQPTLDAAAVFAPDVARVDIEVSTLMHPIILEYALAEWKVH
ncbi:polyamine aminopropyltransferase [Stackebrandtia soli]|uniref:polyamine aminopropyltransferase n=1 Tax=Stackebrandtia soli TaxID=1892856 RepID=UPI0039EAF092